eukprot:CAMPEP_0197021294 /NCGR_PEP_ID=MMETSP1384-20130603/2172_1 /TAXON_ID=29189 /ORGANISM="Ammonia sp." /LENGTH=432 /DNA_ID=CAMNT_0042449083 /DNA_START=18 /DNA_END=1316 /DNA_ORIENTATION=+
MASVLYCKVCTMPPEYCRYSSTYSKCLEWMQKNCPDQFAIEIKDISKRDPKTAKKCEHLWNENAAPPAQDNDDHDDQEAEEKKEPKPKQKQAKKAAAAAPAEEPNSQGKKSRSRRNKKSKQRNNDDDEEEDDTEPTKKVKILESKVNKQRQHADEQLDDIQSKLDQLSMSGSPSRSILKNKTNPNLKQEQEKLKQSQDNSDQENSDEDEEDGDDNGGGSRFQKVDNIDEMYLGQEGNLNRRGGPPPRKLTKKRKKDKKKGGKKDKRGRKGQQEEEDEDDEDDEEKGGGGGGGDGDEEEEENEEERERMVKFMEQNKDRKIPKNVVEVSLENRKGKKKVTVIRGFLEKSPEKEQRIKSEFMKKFATSVNITYQNAGSEKGPKQLVLMGDKRHDFMRYMKEKFPKAGKLLYYKSKRWGMTPAVDPDHGFVLPPP